MNNEDDDIAEWQAEIANIKPLHCNKINYSDKSSPILKPSPPLIEPLHGSTPKGEVRNQHLAPVNSTIKQIPVRYPNYDRETPTIRLAKIDDSMMRQLRLQRLHITHKIDLHDMSLSLAYDELHQFLKQAWQNQTKIALVITGKGNRNYGNDATKIGELKRNLPRWCIEPAFQPMVVALSQAHSHHGGAGAFYVQIRKQH
jgi:DNA-nicking Smr family endonuclease